MGKLFLAVGALAGWFAVILQLYLMLENKTASATETVIRFFSFFTILTNTLLAVYFTVLLIQPHSRPGKWFAKNTTATALAVYITIVGLVYNAVLRFLWAPTGWQKLVDEMLHTIIPIYFIVYWFLIVPKGGLKWKSIWAWMIFPLLYLIYSLVRGAVVGWYPYPFLDAGKLGYGQVLFNSLMVFIAFLAVSLLMVWVAKLRAGGVKRQL